MGKAVSLYCDRIPGGVVCFFVSYAYLDHVLKIWKGTGILSEISQKKRLFSEPKEASTSDKVLKQYEAHIKSNAKVF